MGTYIDNKNKAQKVANLAVLMSQLLLQSGAEVYRVEDTGFRVCNSCKGIEEVNVFVTTNMIIVSFLYYNENIFSNMGFSRKKKRWKQLPEADN